MNADELITKTDLLQTEAHIIKAVSDLMNRSCNLPKKWLKSNEVMELLGLSSSGLQNLRINATIPYTKLGGVIYYDYEEILKILEKNKRNSG